MFLTLGWARRRPEVSSVTSDYFGEHNSASYAVNYLAICNTVETWRRLIIVLSHVLVKWLSREAMFPRHLC